MILPLRRFPDSLYILVFVPRSFLSFSFLALLRRASNGPRFLLLFGSDLSDLLGLWDAVDVHLADIILKMLDLLNDVSE